ncbi:MAG TPA: hypothetical protein DDZ76_15340 [Xanthomonadales bacterium]|nr:hypothetical protein [Xanthomonadales bacterium]
MPLICGLPAKLPCEKEPGSFPIAALRPLMRLLPSDFITSWKSSPDNTSRSAVSFCSIGDCES